MSPDLQGQIKAAIVEWLTEALKQYEGPVEQPLDQRVKAEWIVGQALSKGQP